jgi:hypothetical protein
MVGSLAGRATRGSLMGLAETIALVGLCLGANWFRDPGLLRALTAPVLVTVAFGWVVARGLGFLVGGSGSGGNAGNFACSQVVPVCGHLPLAAAVGTDCTAAAMGWVGLGFLQGCRSQSFRSLRSCRGRWVIPIRCLPPIRDLAGPRVGGLVAWCCCRETVADAFCLGWKVILVQAVGLARSWFAEGSCQDWRPPLRLAATSACGASSLAGMSSSAWMS